MFDIYGDIFQKRGHLYHRAMTMYPHARREEFHQVVRQAGIQAGDLVCDIPSGGGYMRHYVPRFANVIHLETSPVFANLCLDNGKGRVVLGTLEHLPFEPESVHRIISLAALHHIDQKLRFFQEASRVVKQGGTLTIADVKAHSDPAAFLDIFVHEHNSMGHQGQYVADETLEEMRRAGFTIMESSTLPLSWTFASPSAMGEFCRLLFGIDRAEVPRVIEGIDTHVGYTVIGNTCRMNWELLFIQARKT